MPPPDRLRKEAKILRGIAPDDPKVTSAALLRLADLFIGPSSGPLNLAAAGGTEAFGPFGSTPVLTYSKFIRAIVPKGGPPARHGADIVHAGAGADRAVFVTAQSRAITSRSVLTHDAPKTMRIDTDTPLFQVLDYVTH